MISRSGNSACDGFMNKLRLGTCKVKKVEGSGGGREVGGEFYLSKLVRSSGGGGGFFKG